MIPVVIRPSKLFVTMLALQDPDDITVSHAAMKDEEEGTTWRVVWLSGTHLAFAEVSSSRRDWTFGDPPLGNEDARVQAWTSTLADVSYLGVTEVRAAPRFGSDWAGDTCHLSPYA